MAEPVQIIYSNVEQTPISRYVNGTSTPVLTAMERLGDGREVPGVYILTATNVTPTHADLVVSTDNGSIQHGRIVTVLRDNLTWHSDLVRGYRFRINNTGTMADGWSAVVYAGVWMGIADAGNPTAQKTSAEFGIDVVTQEFLPGAVAGAVSGEHFIWRAGVKNVSGERMVNCYAEIIPWLISVPTSGKGFNYIDNEGDPLENAATSGGKKTLPYRFTFANKNTGVTPNTIQVYYEKTPSGIIVPFTAVSLDDSIAYSSALGLNANGTTVYRITSPLEIAGIKFSIDPAVANADVVDAYVYDKRWVEITSDVSSNPGPRPSDEGGTTWGTAPVGLTQVGNPYGARNITPNGIAWLWQKITVPPGAAWEKNPHPTGFRVRARLAGFTGV